MIEKLDIKRLREEGTAQLREEKHYARLARALWALRARGRSR